MTLNNQYQEATEWLFQQFPQYQIVGAKAFKPTLDNIRRLLEWIDNPQDDLKFIHVAGSNGKGSTCSMMASILTESGYKVGLYTSPHIQDYTERIRINGNPIEKQAVVDFVNQIKEHEFDFQPSFFEITFALSLHYFRKQRCDICVIETGLGGRLDATNVILPIISLITSISLEHTNFLGNTIKEIAFEKGGIIKETTPVVIGNVSNEAHEVFEELASERNAPFYDYDSLTPLPDNFPLLGGYQKENFQLAMTGLHIIKKFGFNTNQESITKGLKNLTQNTGFYGRLQVVKNNPLTIIDVSHNVDGIRKTLNSLDEIVKGELHIIYGTSSDKDINSIVRLFPADLNLTFTQFSNPRSATVEQLKSAAEQLNFKKINFFSNFDEAYSSVQNTAKQEDTILIIGSFFLVSDFF